MHLILLSGGSGKRLWPLSNDVRSKQFLKLLDGPNDQKESMVQRVYRQLQEVGGWESITIAASSSQRDQIELQLGRNINLVIEPERRDTFPAIALACAFLYSERYVRRDEVVVILPVDPYVDDDFFTRVKEIEKTLEMTGGGGGLSYWEQLPYFLLKSMDTLFRKKNLTRLNFSKKSQVQCWPKV